jgi:FlaA1/EpsC-like NDP-sugar epimerase
MEKVYILRDFLLRYRRYLAALLQFTLVVSSFWTAYALRFDLHIPPAFWDRFLDLLPAVLLIKLLVFWRHGLLRGWWKYVSMADLLIIFRANLFASLAVLAYAVLVYRFEYIPRTVLIMDGTLCFLLMGGVRFCIRAFRENYFPMPHFFEPCRTHVLVVGAGDAGQMIVREIRLNPRLKKQVVGFVDDNPSKLGLRIQGVPVLGGKEDIGTLCQKFRVDEVIIAIPSASGAQMRKIVDKCHAAMVKFKTLPGVGDLIDGRVSVQHIKDVDVEDLLGRDPVRLDTHKIRAYITGKRVLITGAAGSIGSELCRQVARFNPARILLFDNSETPLFQIEQELSGQFPEIPLRAILGDIRNQAKVEAVFDEFLPEVVFHAAAYKHVPMLEYNPAEAVNNNILGTKIVADAAHAFGVQNFVMVSTDKAVNPTNIMGATKRGAELYVQTLARRSRTNFITVRLGNVLGSNGSVVPIFKEQIKKGGPVTVTHAEVTRFFMTIPEATQLVLQAGSMGKGGEIFLLDMGAPIKILHLAEELIRLSGLRPYEDIDITFTGLRPGEKLHEELFLSAEGALPTSHEKIMVANAANCNEGVLHRRLKELFRCAKTMDMASTVSILKEIVPEYLDAEKPLGKVYLHPAVNQDVIIL